MDYIILKYDVVKNVREEKKTEDPKDDRKVKYLANSFKVWNEEIGRISDHKLVTCQIQIPKVLEEKEEKEITIFETKEDMSWKRNDNEDRKFWDRLIEEGNKIMPKWIEKKEERTEQKSQLCDANVILQEYREYLDQVLTI